MTCETCTGNVQLKTFACDVHGVCTIGKNVGEMACCKSCSDYTALKKPTTRNLLFHLAPFETNPGLWRWHVSQLRQNQSLFNGSRHVAIVVGEGLANPNTVRDELGGGFEIIELPNDPSLREVATFEALFAKVMTDDQSQVTLYAQSKGVTRDPKTELGKTARRWAELLWETYTSYWPAVEAVLDKYPVAGSFIRRGQFFRESVSSWHYSGSWFWFRNRDLFAKDWRKIDRFWSGIEPYPSLHFAAQDAGLIFKDGGSNKDDWLYLPSAWPSIEAELVEWRLKNEQQRVNNAN